jgi:hypothetical protein
LPPRDVALAMRESRDLIATCSLALVREQSSQSPTHKRHCTTTHAQ